MNLTLVLSSVAILLLFILVASFATRAKVFCQYLDHMAGIDLTPDEVRSVHKARGSEGVRELLMDLAIRADLDETPVLTPGGESQLPASSLIDN